jgi:hypothetical protein
MAPASPRRRGVQVAVLAALLVVPLGSAGAAAPAQRGDARCDRLAPLETSCDLGSRTVGPGTRIQFGCEGAGCALRLRYEVLYESGSYASIVDWVNTPMAVVAMFGEEGAWPAAGTVAQFRCTVTAFGTDLPGAVGSWFCGVQG